MSLIFCFCSPFFFCFHFIKVRLGYRMCLRPHPPIPSPPSMIFSCLKHGSTFWALTKFGSPASFLLKTPSTDPLVFPPPRLLSLFLYLLDFQLLPGLVCCGYGWLCILSLFRSSPIGTRFFCVQCPFFFPFTTSLMNECCGFLDRHYRALRFALDKVCTLFFYVRISLKPLPPNKTLLWCVLY